jgi:hypothetical protein
MALRVCALKYTKSRTLVAGGAGPLDQWRASPPAPLPPLMHAPAGSCRPEHQAILRVADALNVFRGKHALSLLPPADCVRWYAAAAGVRAATPLAGEWRTTHRSRAAHQNE